MGTHEIHRLMAWSLSSSVVWFLSMSAVDLTRVQGVLFDLGGTLDGDGEHWLNRFELLYQEHLPQVDFPSLKSAFYQAEAACLREP